MDSEMQRRYQPNMLIGTLITTGIAAIIAVCLKLQDAEKDMVQIRPRAARELIHLDDTHQSGSSRRAPSAGLNGGFIPNFRIIPDGPVVAKHSAQPIRYTFRADIDVPIPDDAPGIGDGQDPAIGPGNGDFGLPETPSLTGIRMPSLPTLPEAMPKLHKVKPDRPLGISNFHPKVPWKARNVEGRVVVQLLVDEHGEVKQMHVLDEQPANLGLGQALKDALYECYKEPAIANGREAETQVTLTYEFSSKNVATRIQTSGNVTISMR